MSKVSSTAVLQYFAGGIDQVGIDGNVRSPACQGVLASGEILPITISYDLTGTTPHTQFIFMSVGKVLGPLPFGGLAFAPTADDIDWQSVSFAPNGFCTLFGNQVPVKNRLALSKDATPTPGLPTIQINNLRGEDDIASQTGVVWTDPDQLFTQPEWPEFPGPSPVAPDDAQDQSQHRGFILRATFRRIYTKTVPS